MQYWQAITLREHLWHERDLGGRFAHLRAARDHTLMYRKEGETSSHWGRSTAPFITGPSFALSHAIEIQGQVEWLRRVAPHYLLTTPGNLQALAGHCLDKAITIPTLRHVIVFAEALRAETRDTCRAAFGVEVKDMYSSVDTGYLALQSPTSEELLVQAETILLEIIDDQGRPCAPGQIGHVVVTPLHAFAMPLLRYDIGDLAEAGGKAACGRGLPVIRRVIGRARDMVRLPDGREHYPNVSGVGKGLYKIIQWQVARVAEQTVELRLVVRAPLDATEEEALRQKVREGFNYPFEVRIAYLVEIPRAPSGKFFEYVSEIE
ncbi:MAG: phenylacetate--CoA ligase family protein [Alphaproteobacteria bacterium]|nr:phenylacetate--CoA ligase family protein [Alphaproteobacteria bacterium]